MHFLTATVVMAAGLSTSISALPVGDTVLNNVEARQVAKLDASAGGFSSGSGFSSARDVEARAVAALDGSAGGFSSGSGFNSARDVEARQDYTAIADVISGGDGRAKLNPAVISKRLERDIASEDVEARTVAALDASAGGFSSGSGFNSARDVEARQVLKDTESVRPALNPAVIKGLRTRQVLKDTESVRPALNPAVIKGLRTRQVLKDTESVRPALNPAVIKGLRARDIDSEDIEARQVAKLNANVGGFSSEGGLSSL